MATAYYRFDCNCRIEINSVPAGFVFIFGEQSDISEETSSWTRIGEKLNGTDPTEKSY